MVIQIYRLVFAAGIIDLKESDLVGGFAILISAFGHCPRMGSLLYLRTVPWKVARLHQKFHIPELQYTGGEGFDSCS
jgi:ABC-type transporter Mla MlaB component